MMERKQRCGCTRACVAQGPPAAAPAVPPPLRRRAAAGPSPARACAACTTFTTSPLSPARPIARPVNGSSSAEGCSESEARPASPSVSRALPPLPPATRHLQISLQQQESSESPPSGPVAGAGEWAVWQQIAPSSRAPAAPCRTPHGGDPRDSAVAKGRRHTRSSPQCRRRHFASPPLRRPPHPHPLPCAASSPSPRPGLAAAAAGNHGGLRRPGGCVLRLHSGLVHGSEARQASAMWDSSSEAREARHSPCGADCALLTAPAAPSTLPPPLTAAASPSALPALLAALSPSPRPSAARARPRATSPGAPPAPSWPCWPS